MNRIPRITSLFLGAEVILYLSFLALDLTGHSGPTVPLKFGGILLCLIYAVLCAHGGGDTLVLPALLFTAAADVFLLVLGRFYSLGVVLFLAAQTGYLLRLRRGGAPTAAWLRLALPLLLALAAFRFGIATPLNLLVCLYFSQLLSNTVLAWYSRKWLFAVGLTLFVGCDVCVGLFNLGLGGALSAVGMWFFYLPSQVLIVLSAKEAFHERS